MIDCIFFATLGQLLTDTSHTLLPVGTQRECSKVCVGNTNKIGFILVICWVCFITNLKRFGIDDDDDDYDDDDDDDDDDNSLCLSNAQAQPDMLLFEASRYLKPPVPC